MLGINEQRLLADLEELGQIGQTPEGGVSRPALSDLDVAGRNWFKQRVANAGLDCRQDGAANLSVTLPSRQPDAPILLVGSHLDSVPNGGRFDGALGVLAAFEALRTIQEAALDFPFDLECVSFTDEEGTWLGLLGSRAFAGTLTVQDLEQVRGGKGAFEAALARVGATPESVLTAKRDFSKYHAFVEVHIEQGTRLESAGLDIGVVTEIVGIRWHRLTFLGEAAHAGTMPMAKRKDAAWGASMFVQRGAALVQEAFSPGVMNCGQAKFQPGAFNIVPQRVELGLEIRHGKLETLEAMQERLFALARECAKAFDLGFETTPVSRIPPAPMDAQVVTAIEHAAEALGLSHTRLMSFAGHDTQTLSGVMPSAMFFVPSVDGVSHNPKEYTHPQDVVNAANVMLHALLTLAGVSS